MLIGRVMTDGRLNARLKADITDNLVLKGHTLVTSKTVEHVFIHCFNGYIMLISLFTFCVS